MKLALLGDCRIDGPFRETVATLPSRLPGADWYVLNLECAVSDQPDSTQRKRHSLVATYADLDYILDAFVGRVVLNLENNHAGDAGPAALNRLCAYLKQRGVPYACGNTPAVLPGDGTRRLGILGAQVNLHGVLSHAQGELTMANVSEQRRRVDALVCYLHWGEEYVFFPSPQQRSLAVELAGHGVDLLVGMHPHVIQGMQQADRCLVYYSLGNGVFQIPDSPVGSRLGLGLIAEFNGGQCAVERVPFRIRESGAIERIKLDAAWDQLWADLQSFPATPGEWYREASAPFFRNHLRSWQYLIRRHGPWQFLRMVRAFARPLYRKMLLGRLRAWPRPSRNAAVEMKMQRLLDSFGPDTAASTVEPVRHNPT